MQTNRHFSDLAAILLAHYLVNMSNCLKNQRPKEALVDVTAFDQASKSVAMIKVVLRYGLLRFFF